MNGDWAREDIRELQYYKVEATCVAQEMSGVVNIMVAH